MASMYEPLPEEGFRREMDQAEQTLRACMVEKTIVRDGQEIHAELFPLENAKAYICISHGFTESIRKFHEMAWYFRKWGYGVFGLDHRGHGLSGRKMLDMSLTHVEMFDDYVEDYAYAVREAVLPAVNGVPLYLYAHSMGGAVGARLLEKYPDMFEKAVLTAPMLNVKSAPLPNWAGRMIANVAIALGKAEEKLFFQSRYDAKEKFEDSVCTSRARFDAYARIRRELDVYKNNCATYRWVQQSLRVHDEIFTAENLAKIRVPVLLFSAQYDVCVRNDAIREFTDRVPSARMIATPDTRHEIYRSANEQLRPYLRNIYEFYKGTEAKESE